MTIRSFTYKIAILAAISYMSVAWLAPDSDAQNCPPATNNSSRSALDPHAELAALIEALAQHHQVRIVVDPEMEFSAKLIMPEKSVPLKTALTQLTRQMKNASWQCVYLKQNSNLPSPEKLVAAVRAISRFPQTELVVEIPPKEHGTLLLSLPRSHNSDVSPETDLVDTTRVYLLYNTTLSTDGKTAAERAADMQQQQLKLLAQLPPEQKPNPALLGMRMMQSLGGTEQAAALNALGEAGMAAWQKTAPDARDEMIQQFMQTVQSSPPPKPSSGANSEVSAKAPENHAHTLRDIANTLAKRHRVRILIDPDLYVPVSPVRPLKEMTLAQALEALTKSVPGSAWRGVYQKPPTASSASLSVKSLVAIVRTLGNLPSSLVLVENPASQRSVMLQTDLKEMSMRAKLTAHSFAARPTYLLYATQDESESSLPVAQRLEQMQMRQMEMLLSLKPSQMTQVMTDALAQYSEGTADGQSQMMRLPVMALMMGVWFPQKAKEGKPAVPPPF